MDYQYEVEVKFYEDTANQAQRYNFYEFVRIYEPKIIEHKVKETSTLWISSQSELSSEGLSKFFGGISILSFKNVE